MENKRASLSLISEISFDEFVQKISKHIQIIKAYLVINGPSQLNTAKNKIKSITLSSKFNIMY